MTARKTVMVTVNPGLLCGKRYQTVRSIVTALDKHAETLVVPIDSYDFGTGQVSAYKRTKGGNFSFTGKMAPEADLWIVYTDGYYLSDQLDSFHKRIDYFYNQIEFHEKSLRSGAVGKILNSPQAEKNTLKDWFAELDCEALAIAQTFKCTAGSAEDLLEEHKCLVAKPRWGGAGQNVRKIDKPAALKKFLADINATQKESLEEYCFQAFVEGAEKRFWFCGDQFAQARICYNRQSPWDPPGPSQMTGYRYRQSDQGFGRDLERAAAVWKLSGLSFGSVDFIGDHINEINGAGTTYTFYQDWKMIADARPDLVRYLLDELQTRSTIAPARV
jgi:hypothetical protein